MGYSRSRFLDCGERCPVEQVSWRDVQSFLHRLSATQGLRYRLPTEAEWEYAARAGSTAAWASGDNPDDLEAHGWYSGVSAKRTHEVGQKQANAFGLHDMTGNVWEWVEDIWHDSYVGAPGDASAWVSGENSDRRVLRGGSWNYGPNNQRLAYRYWGGIASRDYDLGFRVVREIANTEGEWK
jgi:formylglycine-generating enzyme required for sulfatase activity